jgi:hypothetical protein
VERNPLTGVVVAGAAALLVVIGSLMPWLSFSTPFGSIGLSGTLAHLIPSAADGTVTLVLGLVAGGCLGFSLLRRDRVFPVAALVVALATAGIAIYDLIDVGYRISQTRATGFGSVSIGYGLWITAIAAIGLVIGSVMHLSRAEAIAPRVARGQSSGFSQPAGQPSNPNQYWARAPFKRHEFRWWDGNQYTDKVKDGDVESSELSDSDAAIESAAEPAPSGR